ncbi:mitochondrial 37S ribosomal protein rsm10 [Coemansia erecta]|nr:mitochondrial 37S ribosomal protein rsm10 [Coemansia sp. RSA 2618]KAJ2823810.1 mitochondrial 37S ribosomal protein rsm10 [Coemansia erecta]
MIRSAATRALHARSLSKAALQPAHATLAIRQHTRIPVTSARFATTYTKLLDKVLGIDVHNKTQVLKRKDSDLFKPPAAPQTHGIPVCRVAFHSFQLHRLDFFVKFCRTAACHMKIPCTGSVSMPRVIRRWTVLKSPFVHKSSMEVFERRTHKRVLFLYDADPEVVQKWIDYITENSAVGVGMKYWLHEYDSLDIGDRIARALRTGDTQDVDAKTLESTRRLLGVTAGARDTLQPMHKELPVFSRAEVEKLAMTVAEKIKADPKAGIKGVTRQALLASNTSAKLRMATMMNLNPAEKKQAKKLLRIEAANKRQAERQLSSEAADKDQTTEPVSPEAADKKQADEPASPEAADKKQADKPVSPKAADKKQADKPASPKATDKEQADKPVSPKAADKDQTTEPVSPEAADKKQADEQVSPKATDKKQADEPASPEAADKKQADKPASPKATDK